MNARSVLRDVINVANPKITVVFVKPTDQLFQIVLVLVGTLKS